MVLIELDYSLYDDVMKVVARVTVMVDLEFVSSICERLPLKDLYHHNTRRTTRPTAGSPTCQYNDAELLLLQLQYLTVGKGNAASRVGRDLLFLFQYDIIPMSQAEYKRR